MPSDDREEQFERALARHLRNASPDSACPDAEILAAYHERTLSPEEMTRVKEHLAGCARCQESLALVEQSEDVRGASVQQDDVVLNAAPRQEASTPIRYDGSAATLALDRAGGRASRRCHRLGRRKGNTNAATPGYGKCPSGAKSASHPTSAGGWLQIHGSIEKGRAAGAKIGRRIPHAACTRTSSAQTCIPSASGRRGKSKRPAVSRGSTGHEQSRNAWIFWRRETTSAATGSSQLDRRRNEPRHANSRATGRGCCSSGWDGGQSFRRREKASGCAGRQRDCAGDNCGASGRYNFNFSVSSKFKRNATYTSSAQRDTPLATSRR